MRAAPHLLETVAVPEHVAAALKAAHDACDALGALGDCDALQPHMRSFVAAAEQLLHVGSRKKPKLPNRHTYLNERAESNPNLQARKNAYAAMDTILSVGWQKMSNAEKQQRKRQKKQHEAAQAKRAVPDYVHAALVAQQQQKWKHEMAARQLAEMYALPAWEDQAWNAEPYEDTPPHAHNRL